MVTNDGKWENILFRKFAEFEGAIGLLRKPAGILPSLCNNPRLVAANWTLRIAVTAIDGTAFDRLNLMQGNVLVLVAIAHTASFCKSD